MENTIKRENTEWFMGHEIVVITHVPIEIYCLQIRSYVTALQLEQGIYENTNGMTPCKKFTPYNGIVRVKNIMPNWKYQIEVL